LSSDRRERAVKRYSRTKDLPLDLKRLQDISLKWKLIIPFLFLAAVGAGSLFFVSYQFQSSLIEVNEEQRLRNLYQVFLNDVILKKNMALSLATLTAHNPEVAAALARRDREKLMALLAPGYPKLEKEFGVRQFHFHLPPATSFLRLHAPGKFGDNMESFRETINQARKTGRGVGGIERGVLGLSIRSVAPVFYQNRLVGTVEFGLSMGKPLLQEFKKMYGAEVVLYLQGEPNRETLQVFAATQHQPLPSGLLFKRLLRSQELLVQPELLGQKKMVVVYGPMKDFSGKIIGLIKISIDRRPTLALLHRYALLAALLGLIGLGISIAFVWAVSIIFTRRIKDVVNGADEIAAGRRDTWLPVKSGDELGVMSQAINRMLSSLEDSQIRLRSYAQQLEWMVQQRTQTLEESEQTYRTLVENVPLIVYMILADGQSLYLNKASEQMLGLSPAQLNGPQESFADALHPDDRTRVLSLRRESLSWHQELNAEYRLFHRNGTLVYCYDHAVPVFDEKGEFIRLDGIIINVTAQKELQEKNLQAQELETLGMISSRLAHELRNPLTSIGGLARRIIKSFGENDNRAEKGQLILDQVQKLEKILNMMLAYIEPRKISLKPGDLNQVILRALRELEEKYKTPGFSVTTTLAENLETIPLDEEVLEKVFVSLLENARFRMGQNGVLELSTRQNRGMVVLTLTFQVPRITDDDLEHYFFPFTIDYSSVKTAPLSELADVSLPKIMIHKHGGKISVAKDEARRITITISLPTG